MVRVSHIHISNVNCDGAKKQKVLNTEPVMVDFKCYRLAATRVADECHK